MQFAFWRSVGRDHVLINAGFMRNTQRFCAAITSDQSNLHANDLQCLNNLGRLNAQRISQCEARHRRAIDQQHARRVCVAAHFNTLSIDLRAHAKSWR